MEHYWGLPDDVTLYIEPMHGETGGTLQKYGSSAKVYLNHDMVSVLEQVLLGKRLAELFVDDDIQASAEAEVSCQRIFEQLQQAGMLKQAEMLVKPQRIKRITADPPLRVLFIETTKRCNLHCEHCYVSDGPDTHGQPQLRSEELLGLIRQADELGVMEIQLTGGEFFTLQSATELIDDIQRRQIQCSVFTNGTLMSTTILDRLKCDHRGLVFYVSLDGLAGVHDRFRGLSGVFDRTVSAIRRILDFGGDVRINTCVGAHNVAIMPELIEYVRQQFGVIHRFSTIEPIGRADGQPDLRIADQLFGQVLGSLPGQVEFLDSHDVHSAREWKIPACGVGVAMMFVDAYGYVSLCPMMTQHQCDSFLAGHIRERSLQDMWLWSEAFQRFRNIQCERIEDCPARALCKGGCRSHAFLETGSVTAIDPAMCAVFQPKTS